MEITSDRIQNCILQNNCQGCQKLGTPYSHQETQKKKQLIQKAHSLGLQLPDQIEFVSVGDHGIRDRLDFVFEDGRHGLFSHTEKRIIDIENCGQLSPDLQNFFKEFKKFKWPIQKGSFRLRVGPNKNQNFIRGAWLDFANLDIKKILDEKKQLEDLSSYCHIEIGRHQKVYKNGRLSEPEFHPWFLTQNKNKTDVLYASVSSFTQPSMKSNLAITDLLLKHYSDFKFKNGLEWGAGIGNLSIPMSSLCEKIHILEFNKKDLISLEKNFQFWNIRNKSLISQGDYRNQKIDLSPYDFLLLNPARSGLGNFLADLPNQNQQLFHMSCFLETWALDSIQLQKQGFKINRLVIVDQFPQTEHFEILSFHSGSRA